MASAAPPSGTGSALNQKKASTACTNCQTRKSKCIGGHPCERCRTRGYECVLDESSDGRRKQALKRKQDDMEYDKQLLRQLVDFIRDGHEEKVGALVNTIRGRATLDEIKIFLDNHTSAFDLSGLQDSQSLTELSLFAPGLPSTQETRTGNNHYRVMNMQRLVDHPICNVCASPWTSVTDDNQLVSHLISLWFTWFAPWQNTIDRHVFIKDMQRGNIDAWNCSPFLVNAMLAHACPYSDYVEVKTTRHGISDLMGQFLAEAKHHLDQEAGRVSLATVQGLGVLYSCVTSLGKDRHGFIYMRQLSDMLKELQSTPSSSLTNLHDDPARVQALDQCVWASWISTMTACLAWHKLPDMRKPTRRKPSFPSHRDPTDVWIAYPQEQSSVPGHSRCLMNAYEDLMPHVGDTLHLLFSEDVRSIPKLFGNGVKSTHTRLNQWYKELPPCLAIGDHSAFQILFLHLYYHHLVMVIFSYAKALSQNNVSDYRSESEVGIPYHDLRTHCVYSAIETARLLNIHKTTWGSSRICEAAIQWTAVALFVLLDDHNLNDPELANAFIDLCGLAYSMSQRWPLAKGILRLVQLTARKKQRSDPARSAIPERVEKLFSDFERHLWKGSGGSAANIRKQFSSFYPNLSEAVRDAQQRSRQRSQPPSHSQPQPQPQLQPQPQPQPPIQTHRLTVRTVPTQYPDQPRTPFPAGIPLPMTWEGGLYGQSPQLSSQALSTPDGESPPIVEMDRFLEKYDR